MNLRDIKNARDTLFKRVAALEEKEVMTNQRIQELQQGITNSLNNQELLEGTRNFLQVVSEETRNRVTKGLEEVVTMCIQAVFGYEYSFRILPDTKRNATVVDFFVVDSTGDEEVVLPPETNFGGGMIDTISIGLRFGLLKVMNNPPEVPMILDEPAKMVSADRIEAIAKLVNELADIFGKQVIMVTHQERLMELADNSLYVRKENGISIIQ